MKQFRIFDNTVLADTAYDCLTALILLFIALAHSVQWELKMVWLSCIAILRIERKRVFGLIFSVGQ